MATNTNLELSLELLDVLAHGSLAFAHVGRASTVGSRPGTGFDFVLKLRYDSLWACQLIAALLLPKDHRFD